VLSQGFDTSATRGSDALEPAAGSPRGALSSSSPSSTGFATSGRDRSRLQAGDCAEVAAAIRRACAREHEVQPYEICLVRAGERDRQIGGSLLYRRDRLAAAEAGRLCEQLERLLRSATLDAEAPLSALEILSDREKEFLAAPMIVPELQQEFSF
jgi:hypothetical protein